MLAEGVGPLRVESPPVAERQGREVGEGVGYDGGGFQGKTQGLVCLTILAKPCWRSHRLAGTTFFTPRLNDNIPAAHVSIAECIQWEIGVAPVET